MSAVLRIWVELVELRVLIEKVGTDENTVGALFVIALVNIIRLEFIDANIVYIIKRDFIKNILK